jgi:hypothetical protein
VLYLQPKIYIVACDKTTWDYLRAHPLAASSADPNATSDLEIISDTDAPSPVYSNAQDSDAESDAGDETFKLVLRSALTTKDITVTVRRTTTCGAIVQAFLKKAGLADKYSVGGAGKTPQRSLGGTSKKAQAKGKKGAEPEKTPQLAVDGDKLANEAAIGDIIEEMGLDDGDMMDVVGL